jgi:hypothetical protein
MVIFMVREETVVKVVLVEALLVMQVQVVDPLFMLIIIVLLIILEEITQMDFAEAAEAEEAVLVTMMMEDSGTQMTMLVVEEAEVVRPMGLAVQLVQEIVEQEETVQEVH